MFGGGLSTIYPNTPIITVWVWTDHGECLSWDGLCPVEKTPSTKPDLTVKLPPDPWQFVSSRPGLSSLMAQRPQVAAQSWPHSVPTHIPFRSLGWDTAVNTSLHSLTHPRVHDTNWRPSFTCSQTLSHEQSQTARWFFLKPSTSTSKRQFTVFLLGSLPTWLFIQLRHRWHSWRTHTNYYITYHLYFHKLNTSRLLLLTPVTLAPPGSLPELWHWYASAWSCTFLYWNKWDKRVYSFTVVANRLLKLRNRELYKTVPNPTKPERRQQGGRVAALQGSEDSCSTHLLDHVWGAQEEDVSPKIKLTFCPKKWKVWKFWLKTCESTFSFPWQF